jgi:hypothetical protein
VVVGATLIRLSSSFADRTSRARRRWPPPCEALVVTGFRPRDARDQVIDAARLLPIVLRFLEIDVVHDLGHRVERGVLEPEVAQHHLERAEISVVGELRVEHVEAELARTRDVAAGRDELEGRLRVDERFEEPRACDAVDGCPSGDQVRRRMWRWLRRSAGVRADARGAARRRSRDEPSAARDWSRRSRSCDLREALLKRATALSRPGRGRRPIGRGRVPAASPARTLDLRAEPVVAQAHR